MNASVQDLRGTLQAELAAARREYRSVVEALSDDELARPSLNSGWSNGEILTHILFGFMITNSLLWLARLFAGLPPSWSRAFARLLDAFTGPFNWINALGARGQARVFTRPRILSQLDRVFGALERRLASVPDREWSRGMHYPTRWDPNFAGFMTIADLFRYPIQHMRLHISQISR